MQERRTAERIRLDLKVRWEGLKTQGRGAVSDLSSTGCFVLSGGEVTPGELVRLELVLANEVVTLWGTVVYHIREMGFATRFVFESDSDMQSLSQWILQNSPAESIPR